MSKQYSLKFVNEGKSFTMPGWTVAKHELLLEMMLPLDEKLRLKVMKQSDYDKAYRLQMILLSLHDIDLKVTENDLKLMHPDDFVELWAAVYNSGKSGIEVNNQDFQKGE
jgi:hypothetical protein